MGNIKIPLSSKIKMNRLITRTSILAILFATSHAFTPLRPMRSSATVLFDTSAESGTPVETIGEADAPTDDAKSETPPTPARTKPKEKVDAEGLFAPAVLLTKEIMGITELNKLRGKIIKIHSTVIGQFTETAQSEFGNQVLKVLFTLADKDGDGTIDEEELAVALQAMGFDFLKEKEIARIFKKADGDKNGRLDFDEWEKAAPKQLKGSLIKLAKKNGHDLGFLA